MHPSPKPPGRFLPTLTEVVDPSSLPHFEPVQPQAHHATGFDLDLVSAQVSIDDLVERIMQKLEGTIRMQIVTVVSDLVNEQISLLEPRLAEEVLVRVRETVTRTAHDEVHGKQPTTESDPPILL
jgi:hypothetical protein